MTYFPAFRITGFLFRWSWLMGGFQIRGKSFPVIADLLVHSNSALTKFPAKCASYLIPPSVASSVLEYNRQRRKII